MMIKKRLKIIQSHQKSYADPKRSEIEFEMGDWVFLKVTPRRGIMRFGVNGKLAPRYMNIGRVPNTVVMLPNFR